MPQTEDNVWRLGWPHGHAEVQALGGMLGPVWFHLEDGREFQPMHVAPWADQASSLGLTGLFSRLRGEWPCVPFGGLAAPGEMPAGWAARALDKDPYFHGFSAHNDWHLCEERPGYLHLTIEYPETHPIISLDRKIQADPGSPTLHVTLEIQARVQTELPVALHLTFRLPTSPGALLVSHGEIARVITYPFAVESGISRLLPDARSRSLAMVETIDGPLDLSRLPLPFPTEEVVQLVDCRGPIRLNYLDENACVSLHWDQGYLPDAVLWLSNGGRFYPPWSGRHFALGVEPLAGTFDLTRVLSPPAGHPLVNRLLKIAPDRRTTLSYTLTASVPNDRANCSVQR